MIRRRHLFVMTLLAAGLASPAAGQTLSLSVEEAVSKAISSSPRAAEAHARETAADAAIAARRALGRPTLGASLGFLRTNHVDEFGVPQADGRLRIIFPDLPNNYRARAELTVPLYTSGRVAALVSSAEAERRAAGASHRAADADLRRDVTLAYWALVTARERVAVLTRSRDRADAALADVSARVDAGLLPPNDRLSAQAARSRQHVRVLEAEQDAAVAEAALARLVGAQAGERLLLTTPVTRADEAARGLAGSSVEALVKQAADSRPERAALVERQAALDRSAQASRAANRPQLAAVAAVEPARPNPRFVPRTDQWHTGWDLGVSMNWALWDGGRQRAEMASVAAQRDVIAAQIRELDAGVGVDIRRRLLEIATAQAALDASAEGLAAATEARRVVGERFSAGVASSTEVLEAEVAQLEAELERTRLHAALRSAEAELVRTIGRP